MYILEIKTRTNEPVAYRLSVRRKPGSPEELTQRKKRPVSYKTYRPYTTSDVDTAIVYAAGVMCAGCCLSYLLSLSE